MGQKRTKRRLWVIKVGSAIFVEGGPLLVRAWIQQIAKLKKRNIDIVWVTSGAIASARSRTRKMWNRLPEKQALSAIGQPLLMDSYNLALQGVSLTGAQVLLTYDDFSRKAHRENLKNTLRCLLRWNVVPILNENDAVATEEIQFGDNDLLSAKVARLMQAERLVMLTNVEGVFDRNPNRDKGAKLISHLERVTKTQLARVDRRAKSRMGRGGMFSKLRAAAFTQAASIPSHIVRGDAPDILLKIERGDRVGTAIGSVIKRRSKTKTKTKTKTK